MQHVSASLRERSVGHVSGGCFQPAFPELDAVLCSEGELRISLIDTRLPQAAFMILEKRLWFQSPGLRRDRALAAASRWKNLCAHDGGAKADTPPRCERG